MPRAGGVPASAKEVRECELAEHIRKSADEPLVGLALSGGGIRSATFGLGVLQALQGMGLFKHLDYVSTVSGGGYIGGWLQAALANNKSVSDALAVEGEEPRQVRFLRAYSNYLTPKLGLFSGDTWAAIGTTTRNLVLNFSILSLSLLAPLYLPWLAAWLFWQLVPLLSESVLLKTVLVIAGALFTLVVAVSAANMARPLRDGGWTSEGVSPATTGTIYATVVIPGLAATWLVSTVMWSFARRQGFESGWDLASAVVVGGAGYGMVWLAGLIAGFAWRETRLGPGAMKDVHYPRSVWALVVLVGTGALAGALGTFLMGLSMHWLATRFGAGQNSWLLGLTSFPIGLVCLLVAATAHIGLAGNHLSNDTREWWGRVGGLQLLIALLLTVLGMLALVGPHTLALAKQHSGWIDSYPDATKTILGGVWAALTGLGVAAGRSTRTSNGGGSWVFELAGKSAPIVFVFGYLLILATFIHGGISHVSPVSLASAAAFDICDVENLLRAESGVATNTRLADSWDTDCEPTRVSLVPSAAFWGLSLMMIAAGGLAWLVSRQVDLNQFSLHAMYRNRLVRCFLGASRNRRPHPFTGFDADDDVPLWPPPKPPRVTRLRPYPIFNAAINLVGGKNLAWQKRKAASFAFTPEYCGFEYRNDEPQRDGGEARPVSAYAPTFAHAGDPQSLTMGLALATSGAAASPNMGYHSSPTLSFLMTVFNVRLGWWLRNPRKPHVWSNEKNRLSLRELLYELGGLTTDDKDWVYLSDGGHFENLGIYELVRRRCRFIIACDAGQDGDVTFEDLGNAIEKCRTDFGVNIEIDLSMLRPVDGRSGRHCAVGEIHYERLPDRDSDGLPLPTGTLVYIKTSLTGDESADVLRYAAQHPAFPHESTSDQFFDESQFESYRTLGYHVTRDVFCSALGADTCGDLESVEIFNFARQRWSVDAPAPADAVRKYSAALERIWTAVRAKSELKFLDSQMFPEIPTLMASPYAPEGLLAKPTSAPLNYWLPPTEEERREAFYVCIEMLQLMEDVFIEFQLDEYWDHIDNRGWMNLFQHWAWSGMLCATWAMTGSTFDPRFQRFCRIRLDLWPGRPSVTPIDEAVPLPDPTQWGQWNRNASEQVELHKKKWKAAGLNFWEVELVAKYLEESNRPTQLLLPVHLTVESPNRGDGEPLRFNVGYIIGDLEKEGTAVPVFRLCYMRIQNHLRKMGLARDALKVLRNNLRENPGVELEVPAPTVKKSRRQFNSLDEALPTDDAVKQLRAIIRSLP
jgi:hypothetical protein